jgi:hypothetical protein
VALRTVSVFILTFVSQIAYAAVFASSPAVSVADDLTGKPIPVWSGGALVAVDISVLNSPNIRLFGRDGHEISNFWLTIAQARAIGVTGWAHGVNGLVALTGVASANDGQQSSYLALFSQDGSGERVIALNDYYAKKVVVASDGTVWTQGVTRGPNAAGANVFKHFSQAGIMTGSAVPQASFSSTDSLSTARIAVSSNRIGWFAPGENRYIELSLDGTVIADLRTTPLQKGEKVNGFALTDGGQTFITTQNGAPPHQLYSLDRTTGSLLTETPPETMYIYGADANALVAHTQGGNGTFKFLTVQN